MFNLQKNKKMIERKLFIDSTQLASLLNTSKSVKANYRFLSENFDVSFYRVKKVYNDVINGIEFKPIDDVISKHFKAYMSPSDNAKRMRELNLSISTDMVTDYIKRHRIKVFDDTKVTDVQLMSMIDMSLPLNDSYDKLVSSGFGVKKGRFSRVYRILSNGIQPKLSSEECEEI